MNYNRTIKGDSRDNTERNGVCYKNTSNKRKELQTIIQYNILNRCVAKTIIIS